MLQGGEGSSAKCQAKGSMGVRKKGAQEVSQREKGGKPGVSTVTKPLGDLGVCDVICCKWRVLAVV